MASASFCAKTLRRTQFSSISVSVAFLDLSVMSVRVFYLYQVLEADSEEF